MAVIVINVISHHSLYKPGNIKLLKSQNYAAELLLEIG